MGSSKSKPKMDDMDKKALHDAVVIRSMPENISKALKKARSKPEWCSDARWRMELNRRRNRYL